MWWISEIESLQTEGEQCFSEYLLRFGVVLTLAEKRKIPHEHLSLTFALLAGSMSKRICTNAIESIEPVHTRRENEMYRFLSVWAILSSTRITYFDHVTDLLEQFGISTIAASNEFVKCQSFGAVSWYFVVYRHRWWCFSSFESRLFILPMPIIRHENWILHSTNDFMHSTLKYTE